MNNETVPQKPELTSFGLFAAMMMCSVFSGQMYSGYVGEISLPAFALSQAAVALIGVTGVFIFPKTRQKTRRAETAVFLISLLWLTVVPLTQFALFLASFTHLSARFFAYIAALLVLCVFSAKKGIAVLSRCAALFFIAAGALDILGLIMLSFRFSPDNIAIRGIEPTRIFAAFSLALTELLPLPLILCFESSLPSRPRKPLFLWSVLSPAFTGLSAVLSLGALGKYSEYVKFPFYTASQTIAAGAFRRLDVIFLCTRILGVFMLTAVCLAAVGTIGDELRLPRISYIYASLIFAAVTLAVIFWRFRGVLLDSRLILAAVIITLILPISRIRIRSSKRRTVKAAAAGLGVCIILTSFSGCRKVQLQDRMIIKGVGIDEKDGEYLVTVQYIDNYSDGDKQENRVLCVSGSTISEAVTAIKDSTGSEPFLGQNSALVIGSDTAEKNLGALLDYFVRYSESRPTVRLYISQTTAYELLTFSRDGKLAAIDHLTSISPSGSQNDNLFTVLSMTQQLSFATDTPTAAVLSINADAVRLFSVAYISDNTLHTLDSDSYLAYCLLLGLDSESVITVGGVSCEVTKCKSDLTAKSGGSLELGARVRPQLSVLENHSGMTDSQIESAFSDYLTTLIASALEEMINENGCDIYGFGRKLRGGFTRGEYREMLSTAEISADVRCSVSQAKGLY